MPTIAAYAIFPEIERATTRDRRPAVIQAEAAIARAPGARGHKKQRLLSALFAHPDRRAHLDAICKLLERGAFGSYETFQPILTAWTRMAMPFAGCAQRGDLSAPDGALYGDPSEAEMLQQSKNAKQKLRSHPQPRPAIAAPPVGTRVCTQMAHSSAATESHIGRIAAVQQRPDSERARIKIHYDDNTSVAFDWQGYEDPRMSIVNDVTTYPPTPHARKRAAQDLRASDSAGKRLKASAQNERADEDDFDARLEEIMNEPSALDRAIARATSPPATPVHYSQEDEWRGAPAIDCNKTYQMGWIQAPDDWLEEFQRSCPTPTFSDFLSD
jgi:hypothetical protein